MADDDRQAMIARFSHAAEVCRVCARFRRERLPSLPVEAEQAAVVLKMPIPELIDRLELIEEGVNPCR